MSDAAPAARGPLQEGVLHAWLPLSSLIGFASAVVAVLLIAALSYDSLRTRSDAGARVTQTLEVTSGVEQLLSLMKDAETGQRGYLLTGDGQYLAPYDNTLATLPTVLQRVRHDTHDSAAQADRIATLDRLSHEKLAELKRTLDLARAGNHSQALDEVRAGHGKALMDSIRSVSDELLAAERAELQVRQHDAEAAVATASVITWTGSLLLLVLIGAAAFASSRDFRTTRTLAWLRIGQMELSTRLQGEQTVEQIGDVAVRFICEYLGAQLGVLYFADAPGHIRRIGGFALPASVEASALAPTGLTAEAFKQRVPQLIHDVPVGYFSVTSALGESAPRQLVLAPASVNGSATAVLELGFLQAVTPHHLELLERVGEPLASALRSAKYRRELMDLLEETRRQSEELQTQQEELRANNEELETQGKALQDSQHRMQGQQVELEQINAHLEEQAHALGAQRDDLTRAQGELQRANTYKSEFLANMSHELRTPLNSSLILARLLIDNRPGNLLPEQVKYAQTIYSAGNDLLALINDILDLSKIEAGKLDVRPETVPLTRLLDDLRDGFDALAKEKGLALSVERGSSTPDTVHTDPTRLQQILKNLLSNALKFTERGAVTLRVNRVGGGRIAFSVRDTGIGIAPEQHSVIFEAFRQADGTTNRRHGGTGLGLSISRDLARLLGGEVTLESAPGRGSTFTLTVPERLERVEAVEAPATPPAPRPAVQRSTPVAVAERVLPVVLADDRDKVAPESRSLLIIEDDLRFAHIVQELARERDFLTLVAGTGEDGLAMAARYHPSAIVLDVNLPDRSGLSVLETLKQSAATRHVPVHMVSALDRSMPALEMGAAGYAVKPVLREKLVDALKQLEDKFTPKLRRVLVVEDNAVHRDATCALLKSDGVETVSAATTAEALERLMATTFDCLVLDLNLPDRSGFDLLDELARSEGPVPPVVVYTGKALTRDEEQRLRRFSSSIIIKGARSPERLLDEVTLFLHQVEAKLPPERQRMLRSVRSREDVFENRRLLVVEDDVRNIFALSSALEPLGARVEIARNGLEALQHLKAKPGVELVLMDIMMPEMDGLTAIREIRREPHHAKLPIIALTAKAMADDREKCFAAGANDYIAKPLDVDKLLSLLRVWMPK